MRRKGRVAAGHASNALEGPGVRVSPWERTTKGRKPTPAATRGDEMGDLDLVSSPRFPPPSPSPLFPTA